MYMSAEKLYGQSLNEFLVEAASNNPSLQADYKIFEIAIEEIQIAGALPDPGLSFGYFISPVETRVGAQQARVSLKQRIPWFGTLKIRKNIAALQAEKKYQQFIDHRNLLYKKVKSSYYALCEIKLHIEYLKHNLEILNEYKQLATIHFSNGEGAMSDVIRVDIMFDNLQTDLMLRKKQLSSMEIAFHYLLNRSSTVNFEIDDELDNNESVLLIMDASVSEQHPKLKMAELDTQLSDENEIMAKKNNLPAMSIGLDYVLVNERVDMDVVDNGKDAFMPMVSFSLPLHRKKNKALKRQAILLKEASELQKISMRNELLDSYETHNYNQLYAFEKINLYEKQIDKTKRLIRLLYTAYSNTGNDFEDILNMQQQLLKYEMAKITSIKEFYISTSELEYLRVKNE